MRARWIVALAWRDARTDWRRLLLPVLAIIAGVAALVAVRSFTLDVTAAVDAQAKELLGADLELYDREPWSAQAEDLFARVGGQRARQVSFASMAYFPAAGGARLARVRALEPGFPFYGRVETDPPGAIAALEHEQAALVDDALMFQFGARVGESVRVGEQSFRIAGRLLRLPGEVPTGSLVLPRVLIPYASLRSTGLLGPGSRARYSVFFRLRQSPSQVSRMLERLRPELRTLHLEAESVEYRRRAIGDALQSLSRYLDLAGLAALLLGGVGVASAVHLRARDKIRAVAVLRCLGASPGAPVAAFVLQSAWIGVVGAGLGVLAGAAVQRLVPAAMGSFLPVQVQPTWSPGALLEGLVTGLVVSAGFALLPLVGLRRVAPLLALRMFVRPRLVGLRDPIGWGIGVAVAVGVFFVAGLRLGDLALGGALVLGVAAALATLGLVGLGLRALLRRALRSGWPYVVRQGMANLYRPHNQTVVVVVALGFGVFVLVTLYLAQLSLLAQVQRFRLDADANLVLFDIQPDQLAGVRGIVEDAGMPVVQITPVVPMRLAAVKGQPVQEIDEDQVPGWVLRREYNSTYRNQLVDSEQLVAGKWVGTVPAAGEHGFGSGEPVPVSLERDLARRMNVQVGDRLEFDVQGLRVPVVVASLRQVDWQRVRPNFFVVFPAGVLEPAPQQIVLVTRAGSSETAAAVQRELLARFSNVAVMDLSIVLQTIDMVLDRIGEAARFMAWFTVFAGVGVMVIAVLAGRARRLREAVLLRTLGASSLQIVAIAACEYALLGILGALAGLALALAGGWALARGLFETEPAAAGWGLLAVPLLVSAVAVVLGLWGSRGITTRPPLEVLRREG